MKSHHKYVTIAIMAAFLMTFGALSSQALTGGWIKFAGTEGESQDKDHKNWTDISSASPMISPTKSGSGINTKGPGQGEMSVSISPDKSMLTLQKYYQSRYKIPQVEIDSPPRHIILRNVVIGSIISQVDQKSGKPLRVLKLQYEKIEYK